MKTVDTWDWDAWLADSNQHVTTLIERLHRDAIRAAGNDLKAFRSPGLIDQETGHTVGGKLCSVCYSTWPYRGRLLPAFRSCWYCLQYDKYQARKLGLKMLLPLMDWHCQPILPGHNFPSDPETVRILRVAWASAPVLEDWRQENVMREYALMMEPGMMPIHLRDWMNKFGYGWHRSRHTWWHFVSMYLPELADLLRQRENSVD
jgi:hypothetical protein